MDKTDSAFNRKQDDAFSTESFNSTLANWTIDQLDKIDDLKKEHFKSLIQKNFELNLDYIVAITINNEDKCITRDGCEWARHSLLNTLPNYLSENIKETYYYHLNKYHMDCLLYLCREQHLKSDKHRQYYFYIFANDSSLSIEQRNEHQHDLGNYYYHENTEPQHIEKAFRWYRAAALGGHAQACFNVGLFHETGQGGLKPNQEAALKWYKLAAERTEELMILLYAAQKFEQSRKDVSYTFSLYQKCAAAANPLGLLSLIDYHERIGREEDKQIAQNLKKMLPSHYQSRQVAELMQELYQQEMAKHQGLSS